MVLATSKNLTYQPINRTTVTAERHPEEQKETDDQAITRTKKSVFSPYAEKTTLNEQNPLHLAGKTVNERQPLIIVPNVQQR